MKRNAGKTQQRIINAAAELLEEEGFAGLGTNALAARAGVGKPLLYRYFGGLGGISKVLAKSAGSGMPSTAAHARKSGRGMLQALIEYGRALGSNRLSRDLLAWSMASAEAPDLAAEGKNDNNDYEDRGGSTRSGQTADREALFALLTAGAAFMLTWRDRHDHWAGVPLRSAADLARLERVMADVVHAMERPSGRD